MLPQLLHKLFRFVVPHVCPYCRQELADDEALLCPECVSLMPQLPERLCPCCGGPNDGFLAACPDCTRADEARPWLRAVSAFPVYGHLREAVHHFKYHRRISLAPYLAKHMLQAWREHSDGVPVDLVSYIPLHWWRIWRRGYNQAAVLASLIAKQLHIPVATTLRRRKYTSQQAKLDRVQRAQNVKNAFRPHRPALFQERNILLVDDVFTTGATLTAAAKTILSAGAASVSVLTIARD